ncbi:MAG TPA: glycosyltransferase family 4 protein [Planctomycetota bacterium]|nr:glycosyltransferase family 4 protein [Planctomycetota bacterium]
MPRRGPRPVAWLHGGLSYGGGERVLVEQVRALEPTGRPVDVWSLDLPGAPQDLPAVVHAANRHVRRVGTVTSSRRLFWTLLRGGYEAVFTCWVPRGYRAIQRLERWRVLPRPAVIETVHERYPRFIEDPGGRRGDTVNLFLLTYDFRDTATGYFRATPERLAIARPLFPHLLRSSDAGIPERAAALRASLGIGPEAVVVGHVGRVAAAKGVHHVLAMVERLVTRGVDVHLLAAGRVQWNEEEFGRQWRALEARADEPGSPLRGRFHRLGPVEDSGAVYGACDVVPLCSTVEGLLPLMLVEAMSLGCAVVTTDVGGIGASLRDGVDAFVVRKVPDDVKDPTPAVLAEFEARLTRLVTDRAERARVGAAGRARVEALVAGNDFHGDVRAALDRALALPRRPRRAAVQPRS